MLGSDGFTWPAILSEDDRFFMSLGGDKVGRAAGAYFKRAWCLQRSAACVYLLRRRGFPANLVLGVRTFPFEAHAWAELRGKVLNDSENFVRRFLVLNRI